MNLIVEPQEAAEEAASAADLAVSAAKLAAPAAQVAAEHAFAVDEAARLPAEALGAMRRDGLLSLLVPESLGGPGRPLSYVASVCHTLGQSCASTAMIFAMHQIQVACIVAHGQSSEWYRTLLQRLCRDQLLFASVTSEVGTGGNIMASVCAVETEEGRARLEKQATTISYGAHADGLLITTRRAPEAAASDQVLVTALRPDYTLEKTSGWNTLGMRGTCSEGFLLRASVLPEQILPVPFGEVASQTMLPVSHLLWASVWLGVASDAVGRAREFLRRQARASKGHPAPGARRLAEAVSLLQLMQSRLSMALRSYDQAAAESEGALPLWFTADMNNLKTSVSELCLRVVHEAFLICGIAAYKNDSEFSLSRHIRDLLSAPVMINNDRMLESTANLLLLHKPALGIF